MLPYREWTEEYRREAETESPIKRRNAANPQLLPCSLLPSPSIAAACNTQSFLAVPFTVTA